MRRRQHRKLQYELWPLVVVVVCGAIVILATAMTPRDEVSGKITDMWEERGGDLMLEIDNSFTKEVDSFEYHNLRVGDVYEWDEESETAGYYLGVYVVMMTCLVIFVAVRRDD